MERIVKFNENDIKEIIAKKYRVDPNTIHFNYHLSPQPVPSLQNNVSLEVIMTEKIAIDDFKPEESKWKIWKGWRGNCDHRIENATCENCGYVFTRTVHSLEELPLVCPNCKRRMGVKEVD